MSKVAQVERTQERQIIEGWSKKAMDLMEQTGIQPMPHNYAVWYEYIRGANKRLSAAINKHLEEKKPFTYEVNNELYEKFLSSQQDSEAVSKAGNKAQLIMDDIIEAITNSASNTKSYNNELDVFAKEIASSGDLKNAVEKIIKQTAILKRKGEDLEKNLLKSQDEVSILRETLKEAQTQMNQDALTGVQNRKAFDEALIKMINNSRKDHKPMCLLMVDVDHFKKFNDNFGHLLGDQVLRIVASAMRDVVKGKDFVGRYGGEEFAIILPDAPIQGGKIVAENVRVGIASKELKRKDSGESYGKITVSVGVASLKYSNDTPNEIIGRADAALYRSKQNGRNQVTIES